MLRVNDRGLLKAERRSKKIDRRARRKHTRDGDSVKVLERQIQKRAELVIQKRREEKDAGINNNTNVQPNLGEIRTDTAERTESD